MTGSSGPPGRERATVEGEPGRARPAAAGRWGNGRYVGRSLLGHGGTAEVWRARDLPLHRDVAVKSFSVGSLTGAADDVARFRAEVRVLSRLDHPHVVRVWDAGVDDGAPWYAMQLADRGSLADPDVAAGATALARVAVQVADALDYLHGEGIVHRDVKPSNILLDGVGRAYLSDFGVARLVGATRVTRTGLLVGTVAFLAPEQVRGDPVGPAADVYALGLTLLERLTGRRAYGGPPAEAAVARLVRPPEIPDDLPDGWGPILGAMTASDPADRPTAAEVRDRILPFIAAGPAALAAPAPVTAGVPVTGGVPVTAGVPPPDRRRRRVRVVAALVGAVAAGGGLAALLLATAASDPARFSPSEPSEPSVSTVSTAPADGVPGQAVDGAPGSSRQDISTARPGPAATVRVAPSPSPPTGPVVPAVLTGGHAQESTHAGDTRPRPAEAGSDVGTGSPVPGSSTAESRTEASGNDPTDTSSDSSGSGNGNGNGNGNGGNGGNGNGNGNSGNGGNGNGNGNGNG